MVRRLAFAVLASLCTAAAAAVQPDFERYVEDAAAQWMRLHPAAASAQQYFAGEEQAQLDRQLIAEDAQYGIPLDSKARAAQLRLAQQLRAGLKRYPLASLSPQQRVSAATLDWLLADSERLSAVEDHRFVFEQFRGLQVVLVNFLSQQHPLRNAGDVDNYLARLALVASLLDQGIAVAKDQDAHGIRPPAFILKSTLDGVDRFMAPPPAQNVLVASLAERSGKLTQLDPALRQQALDRAELLVREQVLPAFSRVRALLVSLQSRANDDAGLWRLPRGREAYAAMLRVNTTTDMTPEQVHALGLREVARIEAEMDTILRQLGYTEGSVQARYDALEARRQPPAEPDPRPALLAAHERMLRDAEQRAVALFDLRPSAAVRVMREPPFTEKSASAHYTAPAPDGSLPGTVWLPLPGPEFDVLSMRTLTYHEGVPGHHFQIALQQELPDIPKFRQKRVFGALSAFSEGWGLYAESLAAESGWYDGDPEGRLGQLGKELFRARRLVVDTGLHAMHWTRQQAIDYGIPANEVERYVVMPGQACAYKIGQLEIIAQRDKARRALGERFSLKDFHTLVLKTGTVPLAVLGQVVDADIASRRAH